MDESELNVSSEAWQVFAPKLEAQQVRRKQERLIDGGVSLYLSSIHLLKRLWYRPDPNELARLDELIGGLDPDSYKVFHEEDHVHVRRISGNWVENDLL
ncbi:MAG: hypothetical protein R3217_10525 [Gammaproteobacteria bacterium]|nr:hypothetical protein [Gammaproteobacteria bacterium]